jgi:signal transduction histidine kinase/DNA-binding NarL/FixJ family response regulator
VDWACFRLIEGDDLVLTAISSTAPVGLAAMRIPLRGTEGGRAVVENRPVVSAVTVSSPSLPEYTAGLRAHGYTHYLAVPVRVGGRAIGVLVFLSRRPFQPADVERAEAFAGRTAAAAEHARLWRAATRHAEQMEALAGLGRLLTETLDPDVVGQRAVDSICTLISANSAALYRVDPESGVLHELAHARDTMLPFEWTPVLPPGVGIAGLALRLRAPVASPNGLCDPRVVYTPEMRVRVEHSPYRAFMGVPLLAKDRVLGALAVGARVGRVFSEAEIRLAQSFADQTALALENARLFDDAARRGHEAEHRLRETQALLAVSDILGSGEPAPEVMRRVAREVTRALGADMVGVYQLDARGETLVPVAGYHVPPELVRTFLERPLILAHLQEVGAAWQAGRAVWSAEVGRDPRFCGVIAELASTAVLFVPFVIRGRAEGAIFAVWWKSGRAFPSSEVRLIEAVASQVGSAVENARLLEANRRQVEELGVLHEVARALTGQLSQSAVLDVIVSQVPRVFAVPRIAVSLVPDDGQDPEIVACRRPAGEPAPEPGPAGTVGGLTRVVIDEGRAIRTADYAGDCARLGVSPAPAAEGCPHWMGVPLRAGNRVLGAVVVASADRPFSEADERLLTNMADLAALALRSTRLFEERTRAYGELAAAQDQLVRTEKLRALGEMASGVAHDFNNLLAAILGRAQLLQAEIADPHLTPWLEVIERAALDGAQTVRRLQEFTRVRRDQPLVRVDLSQVAREALEITQSRWRDDARRRDVTIEVRTAFAAVPEVVGDPGELREALTNIILNAVDAMPDGGLLTLATTAGAGEVALAVTDTGVGMAPTVRPRIFDPFFTTKGPQGTGLGLAMTYGIVARHGGRIEVESEEGQGSTFRLIFAPEAAPASVASPRSAPADAHVLTCLVVDDEETVGTLLGDILESGGHRAVVCVDGAAAVDRFRSERCDVVFTDLAMPGLSGWQVARAVKGIDPDVPVFIVTGYGAELSPEESRANGVDGVLAKPLGVQEVLDAARAAHRASSPRSS